MSSSLISIAGIDNKMVDILSSKAGIKTLKQFYDATRSAKDRKILSEKTGITLANISHWATQAELLRVDEMSYNEAYDLIDGGIYSVEQLKNTDAKEILQKIKKINTFSNITESKILQLQKSTVQSAKAFDSCSIQKELVVSSGDTPSIYSDLSSVITELGKGVAQAQRALDENSMAIQNEILQNDRLYSAGMQATWYVMPEVEFTMKIDYAVSKERSMTGQVLSSEISIAPSNATFSNLFKSSKKEESTIKLRIVPIPPSDKFVVRRYMPDLSLLPTIGEIRNALDEINVSVYEIDPEEAKNWSDGVHVNVIHQEPAKNTILNMGVVPKITLKKIESKNELDGKNK
ncbi:DUF4332 domain-containing protein [Fibrobacter sp. HC4]|uniref:DUF4332 domain-containing protein n=1 Tax=Fibrobacter sp. HC4 TaxID=3239812 RepID=UPI002019F1F2|nr:DUF4332 domain-containing protein [Fibrobacter succinogenes]MCL4102506.1 hypothetical protein [Fibrobacter succinogenes]